MPTKTTIRKRPRLTTILLILAMTSASATFSSPMKTQQPQVLAQNGGWCWFQVPRAVLAGDTLFFGAVKSPQGDIDVHRWHIPSGEAETHSLQPSFKADDHNVPSILLRPDNRLLVAWAGHGSQHLYTAISSDPLSISDWTHFNEINPGSRTTYNNLFRLAGEGGRIYNFHRAIGFNPNYLVSEDEGQTFRYGGRLFAWPKPDASKGGTGIDGGRPYVIYASNSQDQIHFIATDDHPRAFDNSVYHGYLQDGVVHCTDGQPVGPLSKTSEASIRPADLTTIFAGDPNNVAWNVDLELDSQDRPYCLFSVQKNAAAYRGIRGHPEDGQDHRYHYARWTGDQWLVSEIAYAGTRLYQGEDDYTGLGALDPEDPYTLYISTNAHPETGVPLVSEADGQRHHEIFRGQSTDDGRTWAWTPITQNSTQDNLRPIIPAGSSPHRPLLWLRGHYRSYTDYDLQVLALLR